MRIQIGPPAAAYSRSPLIANAPSISSSENPKLRQTTFASLCPKKSSQTVPQSPWALKFHMYLRRTYTNSSKSAQGMEMITNINILRYVLFQLCPF